MPNLTGAHLLIRCLQLEGIKKIFTIVGDTMLPLADAAEDEGIEFIDTRHEGAAMAMADAWCRITGEPSVAMFTGGPGFSNAISGLPHVYTAESPVIFIAGCGELPERGLLGFQEVNQVEICAPMTKGSWLVHDRRRIPEYVATAFRTAMSGRPGPVHLTVPMDLQEQGIQEEELPPYQPSEYRHRGRTQGDPSLISEAIDLLRRAERPVVIVGNAARYSATPQQLQALVESPGLPIFTIEQSRGLIDDAHPLCYGIADPGLNHTARRFREADVVLLLGKRLDHGYRFGRAPFFNGNAKLIQVDPSEAEIGRNRGVDVGIAGDIGSVLEQLQQTGAKAQWNDFAPWRQQLDEARAAFREGLESHISDAMPLHPMKVFKEVEPFLQENSFIILDGGDYVQWGRSYYKARQPGHWLRLGSLGHLGCGLPYALTAKLIDPDARVFLFSGDGSIGFYFMEYDTAVRHNLPFTTVMGNDSAWGIDKTFQLAYYDRPIATDLRFVRYDRMVAEVGGHGEYAERADEIAPALQRALDSGKPSLVNIAVAPGASPMAEAMIARRRSS